MYKTQTIKARLTEVTNAMSIVATTIVARHQEQVQSGGAVFWPNCGSRADIQTSLGVGLLQLGRVIEPVTVTQATGVITFTVANIDGVVNNSNLTLTPAVNPIDSSISWTWGGTIPTAYLPKR